MQILFTLFIIVHSFRSCCRQFWIVSSGILHGGYFCFSKCWFYFSTSVCQTRSRGPRPCSHNWDVVGRGQVYSRLTYFLRLALEKKIGFFNKISDKWTLLLFSVKMKSSPVQFFHELLIKCPAQFFTKMSLPVSDFTLAKKTWVGRISWYWKGVRIFLHFGKCALVRDFSNHFFRQRFLKKFTDTTNITTQVLKRQNSLIISYNLISYNRK